VQAGPYISLETRPVMNPSGNLPKLGNGPVEQAVVEIWWDKNSSKPL
jgi:hypothetical protein